MDHNVPIAIIGMSCKFAGEATDPEKLWKLCAEGRAAWSEIPASKFNLKGIYHKNGERTDAMNVIGGHFLKQGLAEFDAGFFGLPADLASCLDPQYRLQLEGTYEALESAGLSMEDVAGSNTSMFAGAFFHDYSEAQLRDPQTMSRQEMLGVGAAMAANRISHAFDLRGASMAIDTGCSTTLTALHQACQSLRTGECEMSIVGGANVIMNSDCFVAMTSLHFLSPEGRCFSFDDRASGYGRGEGSATIVLKRLDDAMRDGDPIRSVIVATGLNQDGKTETITTPSPRAQEDLIREVYQKAGLEPSETGFFEAHGTGTPTGDPIEVSAISAIFSPGRTSANPLLLGSVKSNIGHTETSSGLASIIRTSLALEKGQVPPSATFENPNPKLRLAERHIRVPLALESFPEVNGIRRASINNFGYGGANAHVIMESLPSFLASHGHLYNLPKPLEHANGWHELVESRVVTLSAKDETAVANMADNLLTHLNSTEVDSEESFLDNLIFTLGQRRSNFPWRAATRVSSLSQLKEALAGPQFRAKKSSSRPKIGFVFTGQGAQWYAMGRELLSAYPAYRSAIAECESYLVEQGASWSLADELLKDADTSRVNELEMSTPLTVAIQIALVVLLRSWGISPVAVTSHSSGEVPAAYAAGALSMKGAMVISLARGKHASKAKTSLQKGAMMALGLGPEQAQPYLDRLTEGKVVIACYNSPSSVTASGDIAGIAELEATLQKEGVFARRLKIECAYHSHHMQAIAGPYLEILQQSLVPEDTMTGEVIFSSPTTGKRETSGKLISSPQHWVDSLTRPVSFTKSFHDMCFDSTESESSNVDIVVEIGPHAALSGPIQELISHADFKGADIQYLPSLVRKANAVDSMQDLASSLFRAGYAIDFEAVNFPFGRTDTQVIPDLPHYPWNRSKQHWVEPRLNKALRNRKHAMHDLLGSYLPGTNMKNPSWRHIIRLGDMPWLRDHVVQSEILYPGAGFICMAIEAVTQLTSDEGKSVTSWDLRDITMARGLLVPDDEKGVEVELTLRPCSDKSLFAHGWRDFQLCSVNLNNEWIEHCSGRINVETESDETVSSAEDPFMSFRRSRFGGEDDYWKDVGLNDFYTMVRTMGVHHGPCFQGIKKIKTRTGKSLSSMQVIDTAATMPEQYEHPHAIHPTTIDNLFQASYSAYIADPRSGFKLSRTLIPHTIKRMKLSANAFAKPNCELKALSDITQATLNNYTTDVALFDGNLDVSNAQPFLTIDGFKFKAIGSAMLQKPSDIYHLDKLATLEWHLDSAFADLSKIKQSLETSMTPEEEVIVQNLARVSIHHMKEVVDSLTQADYAQLEEHQTKHVTWMKHQIELAGQDKLANDSSKWLQDSVEHRINLLEKVREASVDGQMLHRLGPQLLNILRHEATPLDLMMEDDLLHHFYDNALMWDRSRNHVAELVRKLAIKNSRARIIEIGAGTGGTTKNVLEALGSEASGTGCLAAVYDFTDSSNSFFEAARNKFQDWPNIVQYKRLDIEEDPTRQGFQEGDYDIVIASQTLSATTAMEQTMGNVHKLLKPGGKLVMFETTKDSVPHALTFGLLPTWWNSQEDDRKLTPSLSLDMWNRALADNGFSGIDVAIHDCVEQEQHNHSVIMATAKRAEPPKYNSDVVIVTKDSAPPADWINALQSGICKLTGTSPSVQTLSNLNAEDQTCIFVGEIDGPILSDPTEDEFTAIRELATKSKALLWVSRGGSIDIEDPNASACLGFARVLRQEYQGKRIVNLDLDPTVPLWSPESSSSLLQIYQNAFDVSAELTDTEYAERTGEIYVPRYLKDGARNSALFRPTGEDAEVKEEPFNQSDKVLRLQTSSPGLLDTLAFVKDDRMPTELGENELEIEPKSFGVNLRDIMTAMGQLDNSTLGSECAGIIKRIGSAVPVNSFRPGDRITTLLDGDISNTVRTRWTNAVRISDSMTFEEAASLPMAFVTAHLCLFDLGHLQPEESILIHGATGSVGQAAVKLAQNLGAEIYVTVGTQAKRDFVKDTYGIPDDHILSSRDVSFASDIMLKTGGQGVDVVINSLTGSLLQAGFNCLARFGRFVEIGKKDFEANRVLEMEAFTRNVTISSLDLLQMQAFRGQQIQRALRAVMHLLGQGKITPVQPLAVSPLADLERTFRLVHAGTHMGKFVLSVGEQEQVKVLQRKGVFSLDQDASYLIVGGLKGIGRSICYWMANHGAKHIIALSRSAGSSSDSVGFVRELAQAGVTVKGVSCDACDPDALARSLKACEESMPPIKGVIQGAMVLQDLIVEQMSPADYSRAARPKIQGSWNLHRFFEEQERSLDFFVMLSSISGVVGTPSQANYSAGNTFQDALAKYRINKGLHGAAIDLGVVKSVGYLVDNQDTFERLRKKGYHILEEDDVLRVLESSISFPPEDQILVGLNGSNLDESVEPRFWSIPRRPASTADNQAVKTTGDLGSALMAATSLEEAAAIIVDILTMKLTDIFMIDDAEINGSSSITELGVDSLVAVELRNLLALRAGAEVSIFEIMQSSSLATLATTAAGKSSLVDASILS